VHTPSRWEQSGRKEEVKAKSPPCKTSIARQEYFSLT
jgi:hypothetical protein